jgi:hypothetical protein
MFLKLRRFENSQNVKMASDYLVPYGANSFPRALTSALYVHTSERQNAIFFERLIDPFTSGSSGHRQLRALVPEHAA